MNLLTAQDLFAVGLNTDGISGFEAQVALKTTRYCAFAPEYFVGLRIEKFDEGASLARAWMSQRKGTGIARRKNRLEERKAGGFITTIRPRGNAERRTEQLQALKSVADMRDRVAARLSAESEQLQSLKNVDDARPSAESATSPTSPKP